jgi:hypothetical protein
MELTFSTYCLAQSDQIKQLLLYLKKFTLANGIEIFIFAIKCLTSGSFDNDVQRFLDKGLKHLLATVCYLRNCNWGILADEHNRTLSIEVNFFKVITIVSKLQTHVVDDEAALNHL